MVEVITSKIYDEINNNLLKNNNLLYQNKVKYINFKISFVTYEEDFFSFTIKIGKKENYDSIFEKIKTLFVYNTIPFQIKNINNFNYKIIN